VKASAVHKTAKRRAAPRGGSQASIQADPLYLQHLFSANVRLVRVARGISQEELADRASLDRTYISSIERRLRNLSIQNIQRLAVALAVEPRELLDPGLQDDPRFQS
jgi:ribosome-binding protein aMBF1 (putative translation factor)